jgi:hypothetical protein
MVIIYTFHHKKFVFCLAFTMVSPPLGSYLQNRSCFLSKGSVQVFFVLFRLVHLVIIPWVKENTTPSIFRFPPLFFAQTMREHSTKEMILVLPHVCNSPCEGFGGLFFFLLLVFLLSLMQLQSAFYSRPSSMALVSSFFPNSFLTLYSKGLHANWSGSVLLGKGCVCCSNGCCRS